MKINFRMVETKIKLNNTIKKAYATANNAREFDSLISDIFRTQQFYTWKCFTILVEDLTGYKVF